MKRPLVGSDADDRFHRPSVARLTIEMATFRKPGVGSIMVVGDERFRPP